MYLYLLHNFPLYSSPIPHSQFSHTALSVLPYPTLSSPIPHSQFSHTPLSVLPYPTLSSPISHSQFSHIPLSVLPYPTLIHLPLPSSLSLILKVHFIPLSTYHFTSFPHFCRSFCLNFQLSLLSHTITMTVDSLSFLHILENTVMCLYQALQGLAIIYMHIIIRGKVNK